MADVPDYFNRVNQDLLALIPPDAKTVLEIGCGAGALCEAYRRVNPGVLWIGVEINKEARELAAARGIDIVCSDADNGGLVETPEMRDGADCMVLGDVLEHLRDPWGVMEEWLEYVRPGAQVLACIPNVQHWTVIRDLLRGRWAYTDEGLLDRTHLRFFTLDSIREMFEQAGLHVFEIRGRDICNEDHKWFFDSMNQASYGGCSEMGDSMLESLEINPDEFNRRTRAYQYIVRAIKPNPIKVHSYRPKVTDEDVFDIPTTIRPLHIHAVTAEGCCARLRILEPFAMMGTVPGVKCTSQQGGNTVPVADVLIQQRYRNVHMEYQRGLITGTQTLLIAELDDEPEAIGMDPLCLNVVHAVQVSTEPLAEIVRQWNPNVMVFENQIAELPPFKEGRKDETIGIIFAAQNRQADWKPIMPALNRVLADHERNVWVRVIHDREFFDALEFPNKNFSPWCSYEDYRAALHRADIALLPLEPGRFNECKSDLKFLECAAEGVTCVMSEAAWSTARNRPLESTSLFCPDGIAAIYADAYQFEMALRFLVNRPTERRSCAMAAYAYVRDNRLLSQHFRKQLAWYQELLSSKPALDRQLWERVRELAPRDLVSSVS